MSISDRFIDQLVDKIKKEEDEIKKDKLYIKLVTTLLLHKRCTLCESYMPLDSYNADKHICSICTHIITDNKD